jgi:hypothetical protein
MGHGVAAAAVVVTVLATPRTGKKGIYFICPSKIESMGIPVKKYTRNTTGNTGYTDTRIQKYIPAVNKERTTGKLE